MKVFISWSGLRSKHVAEQLRNWIPKVLQAVKLWMSDEDISTGTRWSAEIASELEMSKVGIVCITPENQHNPWLMFEAGALSKTLSETFVCPYLYDLTPSQLSGPMSQFQATLATKDGTAKIIQTLNKALDDSQIVGSELDEIFDVWWPKLEEKLSKVPNVEKEDIVERSNENILEEILSNSREQMRREDIRLNAFEKREQKFETFTQSFEGFLDLFRQSSFALVNSKKELAGLFQETDKIFKNELEIPQDIAKNLKNNDLEKVIGLLSSSDGPLTDMLKKIKELRTDSQKENQLLLNPDQENKSEK